jgi:thiamine-monophosphate kinase
VKLNEIGERKIIRDILYRGESNFKPDDCYAIDSGEDFLLISSDSISRETHIPSTKNPQLIGEFFANINLSDIAAMGGIPTGMTVSYILNGETEDSFLLEIHKGMKKELGKYGAVILGGDTKEGRSLVMSGTILGRQKKNLTRFRSYIGENQIIGCTNSLGKAAAGYLFNRYGYSSDSGMEMILGVKARINEGQALASNGALFMMDLSDGLFSSLTQMKDDYGVGFKIVQDELKYDPAVTTASRISGISQLEIAANFGGDYELLFTTLPENCDKLKEVASRNNFEISFIGETWKGENIIFDGESWNQIKKHGYEHFSKKPM